MSTNRTGPTSILKRCPFCNGLVRVDLGGRLVTHTFIDAENKSQPCEKGSGYISN